MLSRRVSTSESRVLFTLRASDSHVKHRIWACRLSSPRPSDKQAEFLAQAVHASDTLMVHRPYQAAMEGIPGAPLIYWATGSLLDRLSTSKRLGSLASVPKGLSTADNDRYLRYFWEVVELTGWRLYAKGGGYSKWAGLNWYCIRWGEDGTALKASPSSVIRNEVYYSIYGLTYSEDSCARRCYDCVGDSQPI